MSFGRGDLPLQHDPSRRFLPWLTAVMAYLATLALVGAMEMNKLVERWDQGLSGRITVQVPAADLALATENTADLIGRVIELLRDTPGVTKVEVLEPDEIARLLEPWLGSETAYQDLPLPDLIAVTVDPATVLDLESLAAQITRIAPGTLVDDHQKWLGKLLNLARSVELIAALVVLLVGVSAIVTVAFATRMGLAIHGPDIEVMHLIGAQDSYVARQFQSHAFRLALVGSIPGLILAGLTLFAVGRLLGRFGAVSLTDLSFLATLSFLSEFSLLPIEWVLVVVLALLPLVLALVALLTARTTVLRTLGRMP